MPTMVVFPYAPSIRRTCMLIFRLSAGGQRKYATQRSAKQIRDGG